MKRPAPVSFVVALAAALVPASAVAKGASEATIEGPGLASPIELSGPGDPARGVALGTIAQDTGFFPAVFGQSPDPMLVERPAGRLGPRYTITWVMPGPNNEEDELVQDVYPYAQPHPVSYTKPGQPFWTTERTRGGWFVASVILKDQLVAAGLPSNMPTGGGGDGFPSILAASLAALGGALGLGVLAAVIGRRRPGTAAT